MNLRIRFVLLFGSVMLLSILAAAVWFMDQAHEREAGHMLTSINSERSEMLDQLLELNGQSLRNFSTDYSAWTEMADFLKTGDKQWAEVNIDASLANFNAHATWVLHLDGSVHYSMNRLANETLRTPAFASPEFLTKMRTEKTLHFFHESPAGLLEIRTAPILPSEDVARVTAPLGWWIVARLWDDAHVRQLAKPLQSSASWQPLTANRPDQPRVQLQRTLSDWNGQRVRTLYLDYQPVALIELLEGNYRETCLLYAFGLTMVGLTAIGTWRWVIRPLHQLSQAMELGQPETIAGLSQKKSEFGHLAQLVEQSFTQHSVLRSEVRERAKVEFTLRETEAGLRHSLELRSRLARDLHDSVIQSIYAAGLGLEGVRSVLSTAPALANQRLSACQQALNETIAEVRSFITGLEPEQRSAQPFLFSHALTSLATNMEAFQQAKVTVAVDEALARRLSSEQEIHALKVVRESISNALRHAEAHHIHLSLQPHGNDGAALEITDDGRGFDAAQGAGTGRGLNNLAARAREMGGVLRLDSAAGKGTRVTLHFKPAYPQS